MANLMFVSSLLSLVDGPSPDMCVVVMLVAYSIRWSNPSWSLMGKLYVLISLN
jgi:hypothetical protein